MPTQRQKIVITNPVHADVIDLLEAKHDVDSNQSGVPWTERQLLQRARTADALMVFMPDRIDADMLSVCPRLKIVAGALKGYDNFDRVACTRQGVWLTIVPDLLTDPTAELTVGLMISLGRNLLVGDRYVRSGEFQGWRSHLYGKGLKGSAVGILGMGAVGQAVAKRLRGFGASIVYSDQRSIPCCEESSLRVSRVKQEKLISCSDFVVLALHLTPESVHTISKDTLAQMKPGSYLINPGRGSLVDEAAVSDALSSGHLAGYAADVFEMEDWARDDRPACVENGLLQQPDKTVLTPHIGSAVVQARYEIEMGAADNIIECLAGRRPPNAVNEPDKRVHNSGA